MSVTIDVQLNEQWRKDIEELRAQFKSLDNTEADLLANIRPAQRRLKRLKKELHAIDKKRWTATVNVNVNRKHLQEQIQKAAANTDLENLNIGSLSTDDQTTVQVDEARRKQIEAKDKFATIWYDEKRRSQLWVQDKRATVWYNEAKDGGRVTSSDRHGTIWYKEKREGSLLDVKDKHRDIKYEAKFAEGTKAKFATKVASFTSALNNSPATTLRYNMKMSNRDQFMRSIGSMVSNIEQAGIHMPMHATQGKTGGGGSTSGSSGGSGKSTTKQAASSARSGSSTSSSSGGRGYFEGGGIRGNMADFAKHARNFRGNLSPTWEVASPSSMTAEDVRIDGDANIDVARFRDAVGGQDGMTNRRTRQAMHHMTDTQVIRATMTADSGFRERQQYEAAGRKTARNRRGGSIDGRGMRNSIRRTRRSIRATRDSISGMNSALNSIAWSILPTNMYKWYSILAMLLPLIIAMAVQLAGVATAMLSVVGAGAAMMGIGLLGFGENMAESMEMARRELRQFKRDMFGAFQPVAQEFAPITQEVMNTLSFRIQSGGLVDALSGLKQFEDTFQRAIDGIIGWLGRAINTMVQFEPILSQMAMRFGQIAGNRIISFLSWLTEEAYMNQEAFISFAGALADALHGLYNIIMVAAKLVAVFSPIIWAVKWLTEHIRDDMAMALMFFTMVGWGAVKMLLAILAVGTKLSQLGLLSTLQAWGAGLLGLAGKALVAAKSMGILASVAAATLGILTLGAGLVVVGASLKAASNVMSALLPDEVSSGGPSGGAGFSSSGFSSGDIGGSGGGNRGRGPPTASGSSGMKIIVQGDMVEGSAQRIEDKIAQGSREQIRLDKEQNE